MRISRLYVRSPLAEGDLLRLDTEASHYLGSVLRLKRGAPLTVFNGGGGEFEAVVHSAGREGAELRIGRRSGRDVESPLRIHLGLGISRGERMDMALQKAVELGVAEITPLLTERCVVRLDEDRRRGRREHWQKLVNSACEQCGRNRVPELGEPRHLEDWRPDPKGLRLFFDPEGRVSLPELPTPTGTVFVLSGPEGGFAPREKQWAAAEGFVPVQLGPRILRTETAVLAALAAIQTLWGDLGGQGQEPARTTKT
jgi:16S rRNA (uracil1498-N3)-methyltransferase